MQISRWLLAAAVSASIVGSAAAGNTTFLLEWSGAPFANGASAVGSITFAAGLPANPSGQTIYTVGGQVTALDITVSGAAAGNGTYTTSDFALVFWSTGGATLDLSAELVGQSTPAGPWGDPTLGGANGEFKLFPAHNGVPFGSAPFVLTSTTGGSGDPMALTSFRPIPAPAAAPLLGLGWLFTARRRR